MISSLRFFIAVCTLDRLCSTHRRLLFFMISYLAASMLLSILQIRSQNGIREAIVKKEK